MDKELLYIYYGSIPDEHGFPMSTLLMALTREQFRKIVLDPITGKLC